MNSSVLPRLCIDIGASLEEQSRHFMMSTDDCSLKRHTTRAITAINIGSILQQLIVDIRIAMVCSLLQSCSVCATFVDISAFVCSRFTMEPNPFAVALSSAYRSCETELTSALLDINSRTIDSWPSAAAATNGELSEFSPAP